MAKPLVLDYQGTELPVALERVDRSRLYGYVDVKALDEQGRPCELCTLAGDGHTIVARGGTAVAYLSPDGLWRAKADLKAVDMHGQEITPVASSFNAPVPLATTATVDEYLSHNIRSVYLLSCEQGLGALAEELGRGTIYTFPFSYRGGLEADTAFLLAGAGGGIFLALGRPTDIQFVGLEQAGAVAAEEEGAEEEEEESMDFGMM